MVFLWLMGQEQWRTMPVDVPPSCDNATSWHHLQARQPQSCHSFAWGLDAGHPGTDTCIAPGYPPCTSPCPGRGIEAS